MSLRTLPSVSEGFPKLTKTIAEELCPVAVILASRVDSCDVAIKRVASVTSGTNHSGVHSQGCVDGAM